MFCLKFEEALEVNYKIFSVRKNRDGPNHPLTLVTQNNIANILGNQGKYAEALELHEKVYETRKIILGPDHLDTLRSYKWIAIMKYKNKRNYEAGDLKKVIEKLENALGTDHFDTLHTRYNYANILWSQRRIKESLKIYQDIIEPLKEFLRPNHPSVIDIETKIAAIKNVASFVDEENYIENYVRNIPTVFKAMNQFSNNGNVNLPDAYSFTPLHYAASEGNDHLVKELLDQGADVMLVSNKGNTALHIAASKGFDSVVDILLEHVKKFDLTKLNDFINAKTTIGGTTALHVAGNKKIALSLLKYRAIYNIKNKNGETPMKVSKHADIVKLLSIIEEIFNGIENRSPNISMLIKKIEPGDFEAATNAHDLNGETILNKVPKKPHIAK